MAQLIVCDACGNTVHPDEVRYISIYKVVKEHDQEVSKPVMPQLEVCTLCADEAQKAIRGLVKDAQA